MNRIPYVTFLGCVVAFIFRYHVVILFIMCTGQTFNVKRYHFITPVCRGQQRQTERVSRHRIKVVYTKKEERQLKKKERETWDVSFDRKTFMCYTCLISITIWADILDCMCGGGYVILSKQQVCLGGGAIRVKVITC